jgi:hypothetical protein
MVVARNRSFACDRPISMPDCPARHDQGLGRGACWEEVAAAPVVVSREQEHFDAPFVQPTRQPSHVACRPRTRPQGLHQVACHDQPLDGTAIEQSPQPAQRFRQ